MNKNVILAVSALLLVAAAGAYYYFSSKGYVVRISEQEIQEKMNEKLPLTKSYFIFLNLTLDNPRVELKEGSNRVRAGLDATLDITLDKNLKPLKGVVDVSGGVAYRKETGGFYLTDPVIEKLDLQEVPERYTEKVKEAASTLLNEWYRDNPIYTLDELDTKQAAAKALIKSVVVGDKALVITFGI